MSERPKAGWACLYRGEEHVASKPTVCKKCGAAIMYDPIGLEIAKMQNPQYDFEFYCLACALETFNKEQLDFKHSRRAMRANPLIGEKVDQISDEWFWAELQKRRRQ